MATTDDRRPTGGVDARRAARELLSMRRSHRIVVDLEPSLRPTGLAEAYRVQSHLVDALLGPLDRPIGYKVACTSAIAQSALRIDRPLFGRLLPGSTSPSGAALRTSSFVHRVVEAEFGFVMGRDVLAGDHTPESIADHIDAVVPAIEIVDYRYESWAVGALPVAADNAIHGWWVHGEPVTDWRDLDLAATPVVVRRNGEVVTTGSGAAVLGHPLNVMAWLADELPTFGLALRAGDRVTTGVTTDVFEAERGDSIRADFEGIGAVELRFR
jgi:2-keto-4-pentenoate hydratase